MTGSPSFADLLTEGESVPVDGWDFAWFEGRATEQRPSWGYARMVRERLASATGALDIQTGGGEVFAEALGLAVRRPPVITATEGWRANVEIARRNLAQFGATVVEVADSADLPFTAGAFDLVVSRHPATVRWDEIARVLAPGGTYLSQQIGAGSQAELIEFLTGRRAAVEPDRRGRTVAAVKAVGLVAVDVRHEALRTEFGDVGAAVHFLRKVVWTVPDFTVARYRDRLAALHAHIRAEGAFVSYAERLLVEARKPGRAIPDPAGARSGGREVAPPETEQTDAGQRDSGQDQHDQRGPVPQRWTSR